MTPTPENCDINSGSTTVPDQDMIMAEGTTAAQATDAQDVLTTLSSSSRNLIQAIQNISDLGLQATLPPLPTFVIVGDQSAGKSSVIQSICNITLPRSEGTTTRCPFLLTTAATRLATPHEWTCTVSVERQYTFDPSASGPRLTFQQWRRSDQKDVCELAVLHDKSQLELWLKKAQSAILNPRIDPNHFKNAPPTHKTQVAFSPNVVRLHIESPELLDLSFYDLPGLISYHEQKGDEADQAVVEFIEELAKHYISNPQALVLFACSALQDCETTLALRLIMKAKATHRCIGVITKPDLVPESDVHASQIQAILRGDKIRLDGGWFVTRQSSPTEIARGVTYDEARSQERDFFAQEPWSSSPFAERFGIPALQVYIAGELRNHIIGQLPEIRNTVQAHMELVNEKLGTFPEQDGHPIATVSAEIQQVSAMIKHELGDRSRATFRRGYNGALAKFEEALKKNGPQVRLKTPEAATAGSQASDAIPIGSDDEDSAAASAAPTPTPNRFTTPSASRKRPLGGSNPPSTAKRPKVEPGTVQTSPRPQFTLDYVRNEYREGCASGIPGERQPEVTDRLSLAAIKRWEPLVVALLEDVDAGVQIFITQCVTQVLGAHMQTELFRSILRSTKSLATEMLRQHQIRIMFSLAAEQHATWTSDTMEHQREDFKQKLNTARLRARINEFFDQKEKITRNTFEKSEREAKYADAKWQASNLAKDIWQEEVDALVKPLAYYQLACRRFQETIKSGLEFGFVNEICKQLADSLRSELGATDVDRCTELLAERPERERERQALRNEQGKLEAAMAELAALSVTRET